MTMVSNQTGEITATGAWQQIAGAGECAVECLKPFEQALMADLVTQPSVGHRHGESRLDARDNLASWTIPDGGSLWVKSTAGSKFIITAKAPLA